MTFTTPQQVIDRARRLGYISSAQYNDTKALEDFNVVYKLICNLIISEIDEDYFSDFLTTDLVANQNEYQLFDTTNNIDINKVQKIQVRYKDDADLLEAKLIDKNGLANSLAYYNEEGRDESSPFYFIFDNSLFVYPFAKTAVTEGIKLDVSLTPTDLAIGDTITTLENPHRHLIAEGMLPYIYQQRGLLNEKNDAQITFENKLSDLMFDMSDRTSTPQQIETPNLSYYS